MKLFAEFIVPGLLFLIIPSIIGLWKTYSKAGVEGWLAVIPIANLIYQAKIAGVNPWIVAGLLVPFINIFAGIYLNYKFVESYGFGIGGFLVFTFLGPFMLIYMGFSNNVKYEGELYSN